MAQIGFEGLVDDLRKIIEAVREAEPGGETVCLNKVKGIAQVALDSVADVCKVRSFLGDPQNGNWRTPAVIAKNVQIDRQKVEDLVRVPTAGLVKDAHGKIRLRAPQDTGWTTPAKG